MFGGYGGFEKVENEDGEVTGFKFDGEVPEDLDQFRQPVALAFDCRYDYGDIGRPIEALWMEGDTAMGLEEAGVFRLVGAETDEVPQPVEVEGVGVPVYLYTIERA